MFISFELGVLFVTLIMSESNRLTVQNLLFAYITLNQIEDGFKAAIRRYAESSKVVEVLKQGNDYPAWSEESFEGFISKMLLEELRKQKILMKEEEEEWIVLETAKKEMALLYPPEEKYCPWTYEELLPSACGLLLQVYSDLLSAAATFKHGIGCSTIGHLQQAMEKLFKAVFLLENPFLYYSKFKAHNLSNILELMTPTTHVETSTSLWLKHATYYLENIDCLNSVYKPVKPLAVRTRYPITRESLSFDFSEVPAIGFCFPKNDLEVMIELCYIMFLRLIPRVTNLMLEAGVANNYVIEDLGVSISIVGKNIQFPEDIEIKYL
jgi:hypothetical protein